MCLFCFCASDVANSMISYIPNQFSCYFPFNRSSLSNALYAFAHLPGVCSTQTASRDCRFAGKFFLGFIVVSVLPFLIVVVLFGYYGLCMCC